MSQMVYSTELDGISIVVDTKEKKVVGYRYSNDSDERVLPKYQRVGDNLFYKLKGKNIGTDTLYSGRRDPSKGNRWVIKLHNDCVHKAGTIGANT